MGQKTNPIGNRLGIIRGWESNWYGGNDYGDKLAEDDKIRKYVHTRLSKASVSRVIIERTLKLVTVTITTSRPGSIIGKGGQEVDKLKEELKKITGKDIQINIFEIIVMLQKFTGVSYQQSDLELIYRWYEARVAHPDNAKVREAYNALVQLKTAEAKSILDTL